MRGNSTLSKKAFKLLVEACEKPAAPNQALIDFVAKGRAVLKVAEDQKKDAALEAAAEAIRELFSWQAFASAQDKLPSGDWSRVAAENAVEAYLERMKQP